MSLGGPSKVRTTTESNPPDYLIPSLKQTAGAITDAYNSNVGTAPDLNSQGQGLISDTLSGNYLNANPYLDQTFQNAAHATQNQLSSEFAGAGRNLGASYPARSQQLQTLASNIYGQNYQTERDRQTNALTSAVDYNPLNQLINRLGAILPGAGGVSSSTQPVFRTGIF